MSAQRSLQDLKELSVMNLNIESRKRVNMLINFLKMGNSQLSENIESLINLVETERTNKMKQLSKEQTQEHDSPNGSPISNHSDNDNNDDDNLDQLPIQQVKNEIVTTVKKIVNVVSKVSANSLPEPARSHVREMLLKLPSNWAMMFEQQLQLQQEKEKNQTDNVSDSDTDDDDDFDNDDNDNQSDVASVDTQYEDSVEEQKSTVALSSSSPLPASVSSSSSPSGNGGSSPTRRPQRKQHIAQRLLMNLFKYKPKQPVSNSPPRSFSALSSFSAHTQSQAQVNKLKSRSSASSIKSLTDSSPEERSWFRRTIKKQIQNNDPNGKILILCQESLDMINSIIKFCNDNLQKAEMWNLKEHEKLSFELVNKLQYMNNAYSGSEQGQAGDSVAGQRQVLPSAVGPSSLSGQVSGGASSTSLPALQDVTKNPAINNLI
ncbi:unnamed protein product [Ambrosiozyma monospora]|uniref:Unnamed protein product n=1 Tax=Ambrosiozyma monospora TaxID=43982 RepID=A0A9W6Z2Z7_AMBMO|nr:unnamed protein product [Ambrosiozyma monospora]